MCCAAPPPCAPWRDEKGVWRVIGRGVGGLSEPADVLDLGNAGTGARLLMGVVATHRLTAFFTGDASLRRRPMARVVTPLSEMGATFTAREGYRLPLAVQGTGDPLPIRYRLPVPSAQVKSAILLAGLNTPGETRPCSGCRQRISASTPASRPCGSSTIG